MIRRVAPLLAAVVLAAGCSDDDPEPSKGLLTAKALGPTWSVSTGDDLGFDTGCIAELFARGGPPRQYEHVSLFNSAAIRGGKTPISVEEYLLPMDTDAAQRSVEAFRESLPGCTASLEGAQDVPEHLAPIAELPDATVSSATGGLQQIGGIPNSGAAWTILVPATEHGLIWLTVTGGTEQDVTRFVQACLDAAAAV